MMECIQVAVVVFSLLSLGQSAPATNCEILTQPIQLNGRDELLGRWNYMAESTDMPGYTELSKLFSGTVWRNLTVAAEENIITSIQYQKMFGMCFTYSYNMTLENNALVLVHPYTPTTFHLNTGCPDCMVVYSNYTFGKSSFRSLQLLSRRSQVSAAELEEYKKQTECLNLPPAVIMDIEKGFCPDPSLSKDTKISDLTSILSTMGSDDMNLMDTILKKVKESSFFTDAFSKFSNTATSMFEN